MIYMFVHIVRFGLTLGVNALQTLFYITLHVHAIREEHQEKIACLQEKKEDRKEKI